MINPIAILTSCKDASFEARAEFCYRNMTIWSCAACAFGCIGLLLSQNNSTGPGKDHIRAFWVAGISLALTIASLFLAIINLGLHGNAELNRKQASSGEELAVDELVG